MGYRTFIIIALSSSLWLSTAYARESGTTVQSFEELQKGCIRTVKLTEQQVASGTFMVKIHRCAKNQTVSSAKQEYLDRLTRRHKNLQRELRILGQGNLERGRRVRLTNLNRNQPPGKPDTTPSTRGQHRASRRLTGVEQREQRLAEAAIIRERRSQALAFCQAESSRTRNNCVRIALRDLAAGKTLTRQPAAVTRRRSSSRSSPSGGTQARRQASAQLLSLIHI